MKKILIIGSPGSGKSVLAKRISEILNIPVLHLDRIFHIDNTHCISRIELKAKIKAFINTHESFIIDGNYLSTMDFRMKYADTVILLEIDPEICLKNVISRTKDENVRDDMAPGFDNTIIDPEFIQYVKDFQRDILPKNHELIRQFRNLHTIVIRNYEELETFVASFKNKNSVLD